jgi:hypothetical protein
LEATHPDRLEERPARGPKEKTDGATLALRAEQILAALRESIRRSEELIRSSQKHLR